MIKLTFEDQYSNLIEEFVTEHVPRVGETVVLDREMYLVKNVVWNLQFGQVLVTLVDEQMPGREAEKEDPLKPVKAEILQIRESLAEQEKKTRLLRETVVSLNSKVKSTANKKNDT